MCKVYCSGRTSPHPPFPLTDCTRLPTFITPKYANVRFQLEMCNHPQFFVTVSSSAGIWSEWEMPKIARVKHWSVLCSSKIGGGFETPVNRIELSWAAGKLPHFRSGLVRDISRWQENRISPIPRLNICTHHIYSLASPYMHSKDTITSATMKIIDIPEKVYVGSKEFNIARFVEIVPLTHLDDVVERHFMVLHHSQSQPLTLRDPLKVNLDRAAVENYWGSEGVVIATSATAVCLQGGGVPALHMWGETIPIMRLSGNELCWNLHLHVDVLTRIDSGGRGTFLMTRIYKNGVLQTKVHCGSFSDDCETRNNIFARSYMSQSWRPIEMAQR